MWMERNGGKNSSKLAILNGPRATKITDILASNLEAMVKGGQINITSLPIGDPTQEMRNTSV